jgi:hypothetical protein
MQILLDLSAPVHKIDAGSDQDQSAYQKKGDFFIQKNGSGNDAEKGAEECEGCQA